jgi:diguanylate cyclase (GGDEF)-like protein
MARLLNEWGARAIVFDYHFPNETAPLDDQDLAGVLQNSKVPYYLPLEYKAQKDRKFWIHGFPVLLEKGEGKMVWEHSLRAIEQKARGLGHHHLVSDADGVLRRFSPYLSDGEKTVPFLALPAAYDAMSKPLPGPEGFRGVSGRGGMALIPWVKDWRQKFIRFDFADFIHGFYGIQKGMVPVILPEQIKGKICVIGFAAEGLAKSQPTPFETLCPSVAAQAQVMNAALTGQWIRVAPGFLNLILIAAVGLVAALFFMALRSALSLLAGLLLGLGWFGFCFLLFQYAHFWIYSIYQLLLIFCLFIFSAIYAQLAGTRERSALFHLATRDGLTNLYVIRHFRLIMNQIVREAGIRKEALSIILLDIDHFKKINDTYGHPAGDRVLRDVAAILAKHIRNKRPFSHIDFAARYGGEEFIIMLRKAGLKEAAGRVAERIRKKIEETRFDWNGTVIPVTASFGVATLHPGESVPDPMVHRADAALYEAKGTGRNRVCVEKN